MAAAVSQGITTIIVGQDGFSSYPLANYLHQLEATPLAVNVASYVGHNTLRSVVMGDDAQRPATKDEIGKMKNWSPQKSVKALWGFRPVWSTTRESTPKPPKSWNLQLLQLNWAVDTQAI